jgi:hypothetical protein
VSTLANTAPNFVVAAAVAAVTQGLASASADDDTRACKASRHLVDALRIVAAHRRVSVRELADQAVNDFVSQIGPEFVIPAGPDPDPIEPVTSFRITTAFADVIAIVAATAKRSHRDLYDRALSTHLERQGKALGWRVAR